MNNQNIQVNKVHLFIWQQFTAAIPKCFKTRQCKITQTLKACGRFSLLITIRWSCFNIYALTNGQISLSRLLGTTSKRHVDSLEDVIGDVNSESSNTESLHKCLQVLKLLFVVIQTWSQQQQFRLRIQLSPTLLAQAPPPQWSCQVHQWSAGGPSVSDEYFQAALCISDLNFRYECCFSFLSSAQLSWSELAFSGKGGQWWHGGLASCSVSVFHSF